MKALLDLNVLLDLFLNRSPWVTEARALVDHVLKGRVEGFVAASVFPTLFYIARKSVGTDDALRVVERCLDAFEVISVDRSALETALTMGTPDFEDNIIAAAAKANSIDVIATCDPAEFRASQVLALAPVEILARIAAGRF